MELADTTVFLKDAWSEPGNVGGVKGRVEFESQTGMNSNLQYLQAM